jgi:hypothetical protein
MGRRTMTSAAAGTNYHPTESKYKGGAHEMYVTYDLEQNTRGGQSAMYPKVKRVYIAGQVKDWRSGAVRKRTGRQVHGVCIEYERRRAGYRRRGYAAHRGETEYPVEPAAVGPTSQRFVQVVELPEAARNVRFYPASAELPAKYRQALQRVR